MNSRADSNPIDVGIRRLFDPVTVAALLRDILPPTVVAGGSVDEVRVERCWPGRRGEFLFEWTFAHQRKKRCALFGVVPPRPSAVRRREVCAAKMTPDGLRGVRRYLPDWELLVHSPDCDTYMPQVSECLDEGEMAARLRPLWCDGGESAVSAPRRIRCRLLGYRAGRRAAIAYRPRGAIDPSRQLLGKTFRDHHGEELVQMHQLLDEQLAWHSGGRVRVPAPLGYMAELRMAVFPWTAPTRTTGRMHATSNGVAEAVDALATLHRTSMPELPDFSVQDECTIVRRWQTALERAVPSSAAATRPLVDRLLETARKIEPAVRHTIHRDFYDRQLILDGSTTTVLDLDTLARGAPGVDLGNLLAHLFFASLVAGGMPLDFEECSAQVLRWYQRQMGPVDHRTLAFFCATALFRVGAVHALRTTTGRHTPMMWAQAERVLQTAEARSPSPARVGYVAGRQAGPRPAARRGLK